MLFKPYLHRAAGDYFPSF